MRRLVLLGALAAVAARRARAQCENPFAGCETDFNSTAWAGDVFRPRPVIPPAPAPYVPFDDGSAARIAGVSEEPWACNFSGIIWTRCMAPDEPVCEIEPWFPETPSPSAAPSTPAPASAGRRQLEDAEQQQQNTPSPIDYSVSDSCRTRVAYAPIVQGWCRGDVCDTTCTSDPYARRVVDFTASARPECLTGYITQQADIAMVWFAAACSSGPAMLLGTWRFWQLIVRSRLHWRSYWVGCGAFRSLIFKWPIGRVFFSILGGGVCALLLAFRKIDKTSDVLNAEEASLVGIDVFVSACFTGVTYLWMVAITSIPLGFAHHAMSVPIPPKPKTGLGSGSDGALDAGAVASDTGSGSHPTHPGDPEAGDASSTPAPEPEPEPVLDDDTILKRLGMRSRYRHKYTVLQMLARNYFKDELRKAEAVHDVRAPMKPHDRFACSVALQKSTWAVLSVLYLGVLIVSSSPTVLSVMFGLPSGFLWVVAVRAQHGMYSFCLVVMWMRLKAVVPEVKRVMAAGVIRPPGDPGRPTNGSKKALQAWRDRVGEARSRLTPVLNRFKKIEWITTYVWLAVASTEGLIAVFDSLHPWLVLYEPLRWVVSGPLFFAVLWVLPPYPRRTGVSAYKTKTLIELMQPGGKMPGGSRTNNPQDGGGGGGGGGASRGQSRYVVLMTDDMSDVDTKEAALARLARVSRMMSSRCPGVQQGDVRSLLYRFDTVAGRDGLLSLDGFLKASHTLYEDNALLTRLFRSLPQVRQHGIRGMGEGVGKQGISFATHAACLYELCTADRTRLAEFVFDLFDDDRSEELDRDELRLLCSEINATSEEGITEHELDMFDQDRSGTVDREEFAEAARAYPQLLRPAYKLQRSLRESTLSLRRWSQIMEKNDAGGDVPAVAAGIGGPAADEEAGLELEVIELQ